MTTELKINVDDVFQFCGPAGGWGCGQVILSGTLQYIVIFEPVFRGDVRLDELISSPILLAGWTMDARIQSGAWRVLGNTTVAPRSKPSEYKVEIAGQSWVTNVVGKTLRLATPSELLYLRNKSSHSPIAYENAFWAFHDGKWEDRFDVLRETKAH